jgi:hypothetical protein
MRMAEIAGNVAYMIDQDSDGKVTLEEWETFFKKAAKGKDYITRDDLREALTPPMPPAGKKNSSEPSPFLLIKGMFQGELGSFHEGPKIGDLGPDFVLKTVDGKKEAHLADYRGKKPVVLVFGSFT